MPVNHTRVIIQVRSNAENGIIDSSDYLPVTPFAGTGTTSSTTGDQNIIYTCSKPGEFYGSLESPSIEDKSPGSGGKVNILFMDDEILISMTSGKMLERAGYDVVLTDNGTDALETYKEYLENGTPFDLVILDLNVPGEIGGAEVIRAIRALNPSARCIVTTGYVNDPVMLNFRDHGFINSLPKPFSENDLLSVVSSGLQEFN